VAAEAPITPDAATAGTMADLLAHWWSRPVEAEITRWVSWRELGRQMGVACGATSPMEHLLSALLVEKSQVLVDEHERLFVGPGSVPCPPYESVWRNDVPIQLRRSLMGPCTEDLRRLYAEIGLKVGAGSGEMPDHVAVELEAVAFALRSPEAVPIAGVLMADHLAKWLPTFCRAVARETTQTFYQELAALTPDWLGAMQRLFTAGDRGDH
jgi:TorA maturation chaperone TorD